VVYAAGKAVFLGETLARGLRLAVDVNKAGRGRGEIDQLLYVSGALEARTGTLWARASRWRGACLARITIYDTFDSSSGTIAAVHVALNAI